MGVNETFFGIFNTARISVPTVVDAALGRVTTERCDARLVLAGTERRGTTRGAVGRRRGEG